MSHYPEPQPRPGEPDPHQPGGGPYAQQGPPSGGYPSGEMVPYGPPGQGVGTGGWQAPPGDQVAVPGGEQQLATIGDISITQSEVITPSGRFPIRTSTWTVTDMTQVNESISPVGIVLAILFVWFCLLGLLFLLMKERKVTGFVQVTVQGSGKFHSTMVPANSPQTVSQVVQQVNYARQLASMG